jgi:hypothetical protein
MGKGKGLRVKGKGAEGGFLTYQRIWMRQWINEKDVGAMIVI